MTSVIVHYQEIALKGKNRPWFIGRLVRNLRHALADLRLSSLTVVHAGKNRFPLAARVEAVPLSAVVRGLR